MHHRFFQVIEYRREVLRKGHLPVIYKSSSFFLSIWKFLILSVFLSSLVFHDFKSLFFFSFLFVTTNPGRIWKEKGGKVVWWIEKYGRKRKAGIQRRGSKGKRRERVITTCLLSSIFITLNGDRFFFSLFPNFKIKISFWHLFENGSIQEKW